MKIEDLQKLIEDNTKDGVVDYTPVSKGVNMYTDIVRDKHVTENEDRIKGRVLKDVEDSIFKEHGFTNKDQFSAFLKDTKANSGEVTERATRLQKELDEVSGKYTELSSNNKKSLERIGTFEAENFARDLNFSDVDYAIYKARGITSDDVSMENALKKVAEDSPNMISVSKPARVGVETKGLNQSKVVTDRETAMLKHIGLTPEDIK